VSGYPSLSGDPADEPDWKFSHDQDMRCPQCNVLLSGLDWIISEPETETLAPGVTMTPGPQVTAMRLIPCGHVLFTSEWELKYTGRNRVIGTVTKNPSFERKKTR